MRSSGQFSETVREARTRYFEDAGLGADGGYSERWVWLKLGPVYVAFPNSAARVRAVRYHDIHHVLTGYATDWAGECEIAAWEIASGCRGFIMGWILNLFAFSTGSVLAPHRTFRAFVRGSRTSNLYACENLDEFLERDVSEVRGELGLTGDAISPGITDRATFFGWSAFSILHAAVWIFALVGLPIAAVVFWVNSAASG